MDIAEENALYTELLQFLQGRTEGLLKCVRIRRLLHQFQPQGLRLKCDQFPAYTMKPNTARNAFVDVDETSDGEPLSSRAIESEQRVLTSTPEEGVVHFAAL